MLPKGEEGVVAEGNLKPRVGDRSSFFICTGVPPWR
jgi:hypothetical protein